MSVLFYPDGRPIEKKPVKSKVDRRKTENRTDAEKARDHLIKANMGMDFEADVSKSCDFFREKGVADIYKRPTPIKVVRMSKEHPGMISEAYFEEKSTTDYVGIYKGRYLDFECKETIHDVVPYHMIREQQFRHLDFITKLGGIGFLLVCFKREQEVYLLPAEILLSEVQRRRHPGFKLSFFQEKGTPVARGYLPPYQILDAVDHAFGL